MSSVASLNVPGNALSQHVLAWEPSRAPKPGVVLLLHGYMDAAGTWDLVAPALAAEGHRVFALDARGFGDGPRAPEGSYYHFFDYVFDLADVALELSPREPVRVVGHSMGGNIATLFAGAFPERVARLASVEGLGPPTHVFEDGPVRMRRWIEQVRASRARGSERPTFTREEAMARLAANHPNVPPDVLAHRLPHLAADAGEGRLKWRFDPLHRTTSPMPFLAPLFMAYASRVTCPTLFVSGGATGYHPPDEEERLRAFPSLTRATLDDAGHMVHWTKPHELASCLIPFLET
jgi:pimeloyl-ACP methyl ester carboxylesterase